MTASELDIAITTSVWGPYGRYLPAWAESVYAQTVKPRQVAILDAGITDTKPLRETLRKHPGIIYRKTAYESFGGARNSAVGLTDTEWVIHLDADDTLLPWALADVAKVHDKADVVSLGAIRDGQEQVFPDVSAERILRRQHGMFSCGAFRREFWERRPWHTKNLACDSTFWVGLAHLGARFVSTGRPGFIYRQHEDSVSHTLTAEERVLAVRQWKRSCRKWYLN